MVVSAATSPFYLCRTSTIFVKLSFWAFLHFFVLLQIIFLSFSVFVKLSFCKADLKCCALWNSRLQTKKEQQLAFSSSTFLEIFTIAIMVFIADCYHHRQSSLKITSIMTLSMIITREGVKVLATAFKCLNPIHPSLPLLLKIQSTIKIVIDIVTLVKMFSTEFCFPILRVNIWCGASHLPTPL